jgi:oxygen-independent coproporphyrinogen-3 oxidase
MMPETSLYLHIPFCRHRCSYCDFNTYAGQESHRADYVQALCTEITQVAAESSQIIPVPTIFFGGGTPSLLSLGEIDAILSTIQSNFEVAAAVEITLEANPGTVSLDYLKTLRQLGVNRLSMGAQSAHPDDLRLLERQHDFIDVIHAVEWSRRAGFDNLSLDLMFGLPEQPLERWQKTLEAAVALKPEHLSLYALGIEYGTPFHHWTNRGLIPSPDNDLAADMYELASSSLEQAGFEQYEISNWAIRNTGGDLLTCRHNLQYWRGLPYLGFGAGAHGYANGVRTANVLGIREFIGRVEANPKISFPAGPAAISAISIEKWTEMEETMMVGLRLTSEGVLLDGFEQRFGVSMLEVFGQQIDELTRLELLEMTHESQPGLRLTEHGRLLGNQVFMRFVGNRPPASGYLGGI